MRILNNYGILCFLILTIFTINHIEEAVSANLHTTDNIILVQLWENRNPEHNQNKSNNRKSIIDKNTNNPTPNDKNKTHPEDFNDIPDFKKPEKSQPVYN